MTTQPVNGPIVYLTAGAGGMICGSCLHDNTLARALQRRGVDVHLIPTYTPIRTDEENVSTTEIFYGGINIFLGQHVPLFQRLPPWLTRWLDHPTFLRWATKRAAATSAASLGDLTISMLRGVEGNQRRELEQLCLWLAALRPKLVVLSNALIAGCVPRLKELLGVPVLVTLQGDDIFLDFLPGPYREQSLAELRRLTRQIDGFLVNSQFYAARMGAMLEIPSEKMAQVPLGLDVTGYPSLGDTAAQRRTPAAERVPTIGYLARVTPEKGFHLLVDAFIELKQRKTLAGLRLHAAGWQGPQHADYFQQQLAKLREARCEGDFYYAGTVTRAQKIDFLRGLDIFSVPAPYADPKGLYVLEALAAGVPVVQPDHGCFPELLAVTGGGRLVPPGDHISLAGALEELLQNRDERQCLAEVGQKNVHTLFHADAMADSVWKVWQRFMAQPVPATR